MNNISPVLTESGKEKINELFGAFSFEDIVSEITEGKFSFEGGGIVNKIISLFLGELRSSFALMGVLISIVIVSALINNLQESFKRESVGKMAHFSIYIYIATIAVTAFEAASGYVYETLRDITILMESIIPIMSVLCATGGGTVMATMTHPVIFFVCSGMNWLIKTVITPLALLRGATALLCGLNQNNAMGEFSQLFAKVHKALLALSMTLFAGFLGISKFAASSFDTLAARGIKFAITATVPVVGGSLAEAMNSVAGSAVLLKNAVGITGIISLFALFVIPMIKLGALSVIYKVTSAVAAPIADKDIIETLKRIGECIDMLFSSVACMGAIMIIALAALM